MHKVAPVVTLLAQMAASVEDDFVDQGAVERVKSMIAEVMSTARANMEAAQMAEDEA